jgi:hypothetical protein
MDPLVRTARTTGLLYLGLALSGGLSFILIRNQIFVPHEPAATLRNLLEHESLARIGVAMEMAVVVTQALVAVWFFRLFRSVDAVAAGTLAAFGLVNAVAILCSAASLATALDVAGDGELAAAPGRAVTTQTMYLVSGQLWGVGALFFGLWLIPMGWLVVRSGWMPRSLGWILMGGGIGYVLSAFVVQLAPNVSAVGDVLTIPATVGEVWMVGYLLIFGVRRTAIEERSTAPRATVMPVTSTSA